MIIEQQKHCRDLPGSDPGSADTTLTVCMQTCSSMNVAIKTYMTGLRADKKTLASWTRKAKAAGLSFNKWAHLVLNNAPDVRPVQPAEIIKES